MRSKEDEEVKFKEVIDVTKHETIHGWLGQVEYQMRYTLATLLQEAMADFHNLTKEAGSFHAFFCVP